MNFSLDKLVKNLSDEDFKYSVEEFGSENLELWKLKNAYPYEYMNSFERFHEEKLPARKYFFSSTKKGKIGKDYSLIWPFHSMFSFKNINSTHAI